MGFSLSLSYYGIFPFGPEQNRAHSTYIVHTLRPASPHAIETQRFTPPSLRLYFFITYFIILLFYFYNFSLHHSTDDNAPPAFAPVPSFFHRIGHAKKDGGREYFVQARVGTFDLAAAGALVEAQGAVRGRLVIKYALLVRVGIV